MKSAAAIELTATNGAPALIFVEHIVGVRPHNANNREGDADVITDNGGQWVVSENYDKVMELLKKAWRQ